MCGRYATSRNAADLASLFEAQDDTDGALAPDYNVAPTDPVPVVRISGRLGGPAVSVARWGLVPPWATDARVGARMINARSETIVTSSAYAVPFARRRCLIPADGWYEWVRDTGGRGKRPYFMTFPDGAPVVFAGIWSVWGDRRLTCCIVTAPAIGDLAAVHDRMPLVLPADRWSAWLTAPAGDDLLAPTPESLVAELEIRPVGAAVGNVRNDGPQLVARVAAPPPGAIDDDPIDLRLF
ncbi:MAG TPA: SOS response-associated peptidase [Micromonosporaceae bacterium]|nr:SOS response-associated peptidase [Micromonosporaceae bacterium]